MTFLGSIFLGYVAMEMARNDDGSLPWDFTARKM